MTETSQHGDFAKLYSDGLCFPKNPGGWACYGWIAFGAHRQKLGEGLGCVGQGEGMTNNVAEYHGAIAALQWAVQHGYEGIMLCSDSELLVNQANGKRAVNAPHLIELRDKIMEICAGRNVEFTWVPREENELADELSRRAYFEATGKDATPQGPTALPATEKQVRYLRLLGWTGEVEESLTMARASELINQLKGSSSRGRK